MLTYNVGVRQDGAHSRPNKKEVFASKLQDDVRKITNSCDVMLLQEVNQEWHDVIRASLPRGAPGRVSGAGASDQGAV